MAKKKAPGAISEYLRKLGKKGGKRRLETMTPEERSAIAKRAAAKSAEVRSEKAKKKAEERVEPKPLDTHKKRGGSEQQ